MLVHFSVLLSLNGRADGYGLAAVDMLGREGARLAFIALNAIDNPNQLRVTYKKENNGGPIRPSRPVRMSASYCF
jgi:hypothetical protein